MKKFRRILSFIVATAMIMSMSTLCFLVTAEGESTNPVAGTTYTLDIDIETDGYTKGQFMLGTGSTLAPTVVQAGQQVYTDAASDDYSVDVIGSARIVFTAPTDGTYNFNLDIEKLTYEGDAKSNFYCTAYHISSGCNLRSKAGAHFLEAKGATLNINNTGRAWTLRAGDMIVIELDSHGDNATTGTDRAVAIKDFTVTLVDTNVTETKYVLDINIDTDGYTKDQITLGKGGALNPEAADGSEGIYSNSGSEDYSTVVRGDSSAKVFFTAPVAGYYILDIELEKLAVEGEANVNFYTSIFHSDGAGTNKGHQGACTPALQAVGATSTFTKVIKNKMAAGDVVALEIGAESGNAATGDNAKIAIKNFTVTALALSHACSQWQGANCQTNGTCVVCGEATGAIDENVHNYVNGTCACGAVEEVIEYSAAINAAASSVEKAGVAKVTVNVSGAAGEYASGEVVVTYDSAVFTFNADESTIADNINVDNTVAGKVILVVTGETVEFGEDTAAIATLAFTAIAKTDASGSNIALGYAAFSTQEDAKSENLTVAELGEAANVVVTDQTFEVTFDENLKAAEGQSDRATEGQSYTFTYSSAFGAYYDYEITATMGGQTVTPTDNGDGTWTIENVTGALDLSAVPTPKNFGVTITPDGSATGGTTATYNTPYTFTVTTDDDTQGGLVDGYTYVLESVTIGGQPYTGWTNEGKVYTIPGEDITGAIVITVTKTYVPVGSYSVTVEGTGAGAIDPTVDDQPVDEGDPIEFELTNKKVGYTYTVSYKIGDGEAQELTAVEGVYTIPEGVVLGNVTIIVTETLVANVTVQEYINFGENGKMWIVINDVAKLADGYVYKINDEALAMFWSDEYDAYCFLIIADEQPAITAANLTVAQGELTTVDYNNDVNNSGKVDANDAQFVYNMYMFEYTTFDVVDMEKFLSADVDFDKQVDVDDATVIIDECVNNHKA